eukprot:415020_1
MPCSDDFPPGFVEHLSNAHSARPIAYNYFWGFGAVFVVITCVLLIPRIRQFYKHAIDIRDKDDQPLMPFTYVACLLIVSFPLIASFLKYIVFLSPITAYSIEFVMATYESIVLYSFTTLLIMYLGFRNLITALKDAPKTKFYAVPPLGCCLRPCIKPAIVSKHDFRRLYCFIMQYCLALPLFMFCLLLRGYEGNDRVVLGIKILKIISVMICFYGLLALLKASHTLLEEHRIHGKFWCIKGLIIVMIAPTLLIALFGHLPEQNDIYDHHTLVEAYGAMVSIVFLTGLSVIFLVFFKPEDALYAMHNAEKSHYAASKSLINNNSFQKDHRDIDEIDENSINENEQENIPMNQTNILLETGKQQ